MIIFVQTLTMKKYILSLLGLTLAAITDSFAQSPLDVNSYINQHTTANPANSYNTLYTVWKYGTQQVGSLGYGSSNGTLYMNNSIGNVLIQTTTATNGIGFHTNGTERLFISPEGRIGIGKNNPTHILDVEGSVRAKNLLWLRTNVTNSTELVMEKPNSSYYSISINNNAMSFYNHGTQKVFFYADVADNIGLGTTDTKGHKLAVSGSIIATKVKVQQTPWPDYVFEPGYQLPSLAALETYVKTHRHLPGVPSAKEVTENGLDVGGTQAALLEKIEELTLIIIEQNKKIEAQEKRLKAVEKKLD